MIDFLESHKIRSDEKTFHTGDAHLHVQLASFDREPYTTKFAAVALVLHLRQGFN